MFVGNTQELLVNSRRVWKIQMKKKWEESVFSEMEGLCSVAQAGAMTRVPLGEAAEPGRELTGSNI